MKVNNIHVPVYAFHWKYFTNIIYHCKPNMWVRWKSARHASNLTSCMHLTQMYTKHNSLNKLNKRLLVKIEEKNCNQNTIQFRKRKLKIRKKIKYHNWFLFVVQNEWILKFASWFQNTRNNTLPARGAPSAILLVDLNK